MPWKQHTSMYHFLRTIETYEFQFEIYFRANGIFGFGFKHSYRYDNILINKIKEILKKLFV